MIKETTNYTEVNVRLPQNVSVPLTSADLQTRASKGRRLVILMCIAIKKLKSSLGVCFSSCCCCFIEKDQKESEDKLTNKVDGTEYREMTTISIPKPLKTSPRTKKKLLVLDMDETLLNSSVDEMDDPDILLKQYCPQSKSHYLVYVKLRPFLNLFLSFMSRFYDLAIFTAGAKEVTEFYL